MQKFSSVEDYVFGLPNWMQQHFYTARKIILQDNPAIQESIKFNCPFYTYKGLLCYFTLIQKTQFVLGFCKGYLMANQEGILVANQKQTQIMHWCFYPNKPINTVLLNQYMHEAMIINDCAHNLKSKKQ